MVFCQRISSDWSWMRGSHAPACAECLRYTPYGDFCSHSSPRCCPSALSLIFLAARELASVSFPRLVERRMS